MLEAVCPSQHERGRSDCLGEKLEANLAVANIISTDEILEQLDVKHK